MAPRPVTTVMSNRAARSAREQHGRRTPAMSTVVVDGREVRVTNLDKVLWPSIGMTKGGLMESNSSVAPVIPRHIADHPLTLHRFPEGVECLHWYETRAPAHPPW